MLISQLLFDCTLLHVYQTSYLHTPRLLCTKFKYHDTSLDEFRECGYYYATKECILYTLMLSIPLGNFYIFTNSVRRKGLVTMVHIHPH